ncbi:uncharacterized protein CBL_04481 [Carabus blaptoides fortunei]
MSNSNGALASLTATYTDSEGEDGNEEDELNQGSVSTPTSNSVNSRTNSPVPSAVNLVAGSVAQLVSYHDDTVISDDETHDNTHVMNNNNTSNTGETLVNSGAGDGTASSEPITDDGIQLPPEPAGRCSVELQEKIARLHGKMLKDGLDMNYVIQQRKDFRNPSIYEKLIQFCGINELGTNYPPHLYDPLRWGKESLYEELARVQKQEMDRREKERKTKVEVVSGTRRPGSGAEEEAKRRKSKWDQPGGTGVSLTGTQALKPAGLVQATLTSSATGTKGTVISAFGSLPRKPKI